MDDKNAFSWQLAQYNNTNSSSLLTLPTNEPSHQGTTVPPWHQHHYHPYHHHHHHHPYYYTNASYYPPANITTYYHHYDYHKQSYDQQQQQQNWYYSSPSYNHVSYQLPQEQKDIPPPPPPLETIPKEQPPPPPPPPHRSSLATLKNETMAVPRSSQSTIDSSCVTENPGRSSPNHPFSSPLPLQGSSKKFGRFMGKLLLVKGNKKVSTDTNSTSSTTPTTSTSRNKSVNSYFRTQKISSTTSCVKPSVCVSNSISVIEQHNKPVSQNKTNDNKTEPPVASSSSASLAAVATAPKSHSQQQDYCSHEDFLSIDNNNKDVHDDDDLSSLSSLQSEDDVLGPWTEQQEQQCDINDDDNDPVEELCNDCENLRNELTGPIETDWICTQCKNKWRDQFTSWIGRIADTSKKHDGGNKNKDHAGTIRKKKQQQKQPLQQRKLKSTSSMMSSKTRTLKAAITQYPNKKQRRRSDSTNSSSSSNSSIPLAIITAIKKSKQQKQKQQQQQQQQKQKQKQKQRKKQKQKQKKATTNVPPPTKSSRRPGMDKYVTTGAFMTRNTAKQLADPEYGFHPNPHGYIRNQKVEVLNINGHWYRGVLTMMQSSKVKVKYADWQDQEEWINMGSRRIRIYHADDDDDDEEEDDEEEQVGQDKTSTSLVQEQDFDIHAVQNEDKEKVNDEQLLQQLYEDPLLPHSVNRNNNHHTNKVDDDYVSATLDKDPNQIFNDNEILLTRRMAQQLTDEHGFPANAFGYHHNRAVAVSFKKGSKRVAGHRNNIEYLGYLREMRANQIRIWYPTLRQSDWLVVGSRRLRLLTDEEEMMLKEQMAQLPSLVQEQEQVEKRRDQHQDQHQDQQPAVPVTDIVSVIDPVLVTESVPMTESVTPSVSAPLEQQVPEIQSTDVQKKPEKQKKNQRMGKKKKDKQQNDKQQEGKQQKEKKKDQEVTVALAKSTITKSTTEEVEAVDTTTQTITNGSAPGSAAVEIPPQPSLPKRKRGRPRKYPLPQENSSVVVAKEGQKNTKVKKNKQPATITPKSLSTSLPVIQESDKESAPVAPIPRKEKEDHFLTTGAFATRRAMRQLKDAHGFVPNPYGYAYNQPIEVLNTKTAKNKHFWERGHLVAMRPGQVKVRYDGWAEIYDEWFMVGSRRIRPALEDTTTIDTPSDSLTNSNEANGNNESSTLASSSLSYTLMAPPVATASTHPSDLMATETNPELVDMAKKKHAHRIIRPEDYEQLGYLAPADPPQPRRRGRPPKMPSSEVTNNEYITAIQQQPFFPDTTTINKDPIPFDKEDLDGTFQPSGSPASSDNDNASDYENSRTTALQHSGRRRKRGRQPLTASKKRKKYQERQAALIQAMIEKQELQQQKIMSGSALLRRGGGLTSADDHGFVANVYGYDYMQHVQVLNLDKKWYEARLVRMDRNRVQIHYCGWVDKFDEFIPLGSRRLQMIENPHEVLCAEPHFKERYEALLLETQKEQEEGDRGSNKQQLEEQRNALIRRNNRRRTLSEGPYDGRNGEIEYYKEGEQPGSDVEEIDAWKVYCNQCNVVIKQFRYYCTYCETPSEGYDYESFELCLRCFDQNFPFWHHHPRSSFAVQAVINSEIGPMPIKGELVTVWEEDILDDITNKNNTNNSTNAEGEGPQDENRQEGERNGTQQQEPQHEIEEASKVFTGAAPIETAEQGYKYLKRWQRRKVCAFCNDDDDTSSELGQFIGPFVIATYNKNGVERKRQFWAHDACARYSPEVFCTPEGKWYNVTLALRRGRGMRCYSCKEKGATIGCFDSRCSKSFHLPCAQKPVSYFRNGVIFWCPTHEAYYNKKDTYVNIFKCDGCNKQMEDESWFTCLPCASGYFSSFDLCTECYEKLPEYDHPHDQDDFEETSFAIIKEMEAEKAREAARAKELSAAKRKKPLFPRRRRKRAGDAPVTTCCYCGTEDAEEWRKGYDGGVIMCRPCFEVALLVDNNDGSSNNQEELQQQQAEQEEEVAAPRCIIIHQIWCNRKYSFTNV